MIKKLKPANDKINVRDPITGEHLLAAGANVELTSYWRRRMRDGDVVEVPAKPKATQSTKGA